MRASGAAGAAAGAGRRARSSPRMGVALLLALVLCAAALPTSNAALEALSLGRAGLQLAELAYRGALTAASGLASYFSAGQLRFLSNLMRNFPVLDDIRLAALSPSEFLGFASDKARQTVGLGSRLASLREFLTNVGQDAFDAVCKPEVFGPGAFFRTGCNGPTFLLVINSGECEIDPVSERVRCVPPTVTLEHAPASCNLAYQDACSFLGPQCRFDVEVGVAETGIVKPFGSAALDFGGTFDIPTAIDASQAQFLRDNVLGRLFPSQNTRRNITVAKNATAIDNLAAKLEVAAEVQQLKNATREDREALRNAKLEAAEGLASAVGAPVGSSKASKTAGLSAAAAAAADGAAAAAKPAEPAAAKVESGGGASASSSSATAAKTPAVAANADPLAEAAPASAAAPATAAGASTAAGANEIKVAG